VVNKTSLAAINPSQDVVDNNKNNRAPAKAKGEQIPEKRGSTAAVAADNGSHPPRIPNMKRRISHLN
jgi:hypothetical protein